MARIVLALLLLAPAPALAHKLNIYAYADGASISGHVYFTGDIPARQIDIIARDPSGHEMARTKTDDKGNFNLPANDKTEYQITAETPDGHSAAFSLSAAALPDSHPADAYTVTPHDSHYVSSNVSDTSQLADRLEALQKQMLALQLQIDQAEHQIRFRDLLGGIGYILGLAGLAFYIKARQRPLPASSKER